MKNKSGKKKQEEKLKKSKKKVLKATNKNLSQEPLDSSKGMFVVSDGI